MISCYSTQAHHEAVQPGLENTLVETERHQVVKFVLAASNLAHFIRNATAFYCKMSQISEASFVEFCIK